MEKFALIVAGGSGTRMGSEMPKQFMKLAGKPILMRTLERFYDFDDSIKIVLVLPVMQIDAWKELCQNYNFCIPHAITAGGETRFQSVKNGLDKLPSEGLVFIHDGVRPLVSDATISNCMNMAANKGNALPVMPVVETLRQVSGTESKHMERSNFRTVQTPQTFQLSIIKKAYQQPESNLFTDDASVCEAMGEKIYLVEGNSENIKITLPNDILIAEVLLQKDI